MWTWSLNWGAVRDDLVVGSCPMTFSDIDRIAAETGSTALLSLQHEECRRHFRIDYAGHLAHGWAADLVMVNAPMRDFDPPDQRRNLPKAVRRLVGLLAAGHRVYVHCTAGINRSPLTVLAYLTFVESQPFEEALAIVVGGRPGAEPTWEAYHGAREDLLSKVQENIALEAYLLSQSHPGRTPEANWVEAERAVLRNVLLSPIGPRLSAGQAA
jgi:predicted protein tyrosine phosphatase